MKPQVQVSNFVCYKTKSNSWSSLIPTEWVSNVHKIIFKISAREPLPVWCVFSYCWVALSSQLLHTHPSGNPARKLKRQQSHRNWNWHMSRFHISKRIKAVPSTSRFQKFHIPCKLLAQRTQRKQIQTETDKLGRPMWRLPTVHNPKPGYTVQFGLLPQYYTTWP